MLKTLHFLCVLALSHMVPAQEKLTANASLVRVQGAWVNIYSVYDHPKLEHDAIGPWGLETPSHILFENDSLFEFNYPCELADRKRIRIHHDTIEEVDRRKDQHDFPDRDEWPAQISFHGDTLVIETHRAFNGSTEKRYLRTRLDSGIVSHLKKYSLNFTCLRGQWQLETSYDSGYDGNGIVDYDFPFEPQRTLVFTSNARIDYSNRILWLKANGVARAFRVIKLSSDGTSLDVETTEWYNDEWAYPLHYKKVK